MLRELLTVISLVGIAQNAVAQTDEPAPLTQFQDCDACPEMIMMPAGSFMMGAIEGESRNPFDVFGPDATWRRRGPDEVNILPHEHPRHPVVMDIPFAIGRNEVTFGEWSQCVAAGACRHEPDAWILTRNGRIELGPDHPVINVSVLDIQEYTNWLNALVGADVYRLPTEAEWEYAARAGTETRFAQGDDLTPDQANFSRVGTERLRGEEMPHLLSRGSPVPVQELDAANAWGLRHMSGNVFEITQSCRADQHFGLALDSDYLAHDLAYPDCNRALKGGSYAVAMDYARPSARGHIATITQNDMMGFRIVRELD